ncbi:ABC transporter permease [Streptomyces sp. N2-109]|uniref:ABC transporter permease n=1 Tax=Streptomyces gossypii TaxID=2883101 RepID=A0ABT2K1P9_9ACTN|nr:ABC transporter permease [Streptomyces gossypii]MCT2593838.1 ABC transporter permease [Streptomyces gossypii]
MATDTTGTPPSEAPPRGGSFTPAPGAAPLPRMIAAQAALETRMLLRNGEQLLLTVLIPTLLLVLFSAVDIIELPGTAADGGGDERADFLTPGILALAVLSTAFTGQAISTGFDRRYGALKRLAASPLPRWGLMTAKTCSVLVIELLQVLLLMAVALTLGWSPHGNPAAVVLLLLAGTAAFSGLGLLMAGTLRAEATLAAANLVFILLLVGGGVIVPLEKFPPGVRDALELLPITALSDGLRDVLQHGAGVPWGALAVLGCWAVLGLAAAARFFRWE